MSKEGFIKSSSAYGPLIREIVKYTRARNCVEIGIAYGTTSKYICEGTATHGGNLFGFDIWSNHGLVNQCLQLSNIDDASLYVQSEGFGNFVFYQVDTRTPIFKNMLAAVCPCIDFAFIDGCHSYAGLKNDFDIIYPRLTKFGSVVFHDTFKIDGCREFMIDLRTKYADGTYDIIDYPFGTPNRGEGLSVLSKRMFPVAQGEIDEICGSPSTPAEIYKKEQEWYQAQTKK